MSIMPVFKTGALCLLLLAISGVSLADKIILSSAQVHPYLYLQDDKAIKGELVDTLDCIFLGLKREYNVVFRPHLRSQLEVVQGGLQGAILQSKGVAQTLNAYLSSPLILQKWYLYYLAENTLLLQNQLIQHTIGIVRGSSAKQWLNQRKQGSIIEVGSPQQLLRMLKQKRITAALMDEKVFTNTSQNMNFPRAMFQRHFLKYTPLGVLFNQDFLQSNMQFLLKFNQQIAHCSVLSHTLSKWEKDRVEKFAQKTYRSLTSEVKQHFSTLEQSFSTMDMEKIKKLDQQWKDEVISGQYRLIADTLNHPLSKQLTDWKKQRKKFITEILVTDQQGVLLATSDITTDYWQGDENKVKKILSDQKLYISEINYDNSTQIFQVQVTFPIFDQASRSIIGTLTIGLDIEHILINQIIMTKPEWFLSRVLN